MGLFSSEYRTTVGTTVSRVIQDNLIISSTQTGLIAGLFSEPNDQIVENVLESMIASIGVKAERMYSYAKKNYPYGLPNCKVSSTADGHSVVFGVVQGLVNQQIVEEYYQFGPLNSLHAGWETLYNTYGYDSTTNQIATLTAQIGFPVYLKDMVVVVKEATLTERANGSLDLWGTAACAGYTPQRPVASGRFNRTVLPTPIRVDPLVENDYVDVSYIWLNTTTKVVHEANFSISLASYDAGLDYFHVKYSDAGKDGYWLYQLGDGTYPEIDTIFDILPTVEGQFFPVVYFRNGSTSMAANQQSAAFKTSNKMMKTLGINYLDIIDAIHQNPGIAQVEQAMMMFAVPPNTTNPMEMRYLFDFFDKMYVAAGGAGVGPGWETFESNSSESSSSASRSISKILSRLRGGPVAKIRIEIADTTFNKALSCEGIFKRKKTGVIAAVGEYASSFTTEMVTNTYTKMETVSTGYGDNTEQVSVTSSYQVPMDVFVYKHQITDAVYEEIVVYDLKMTYYMWGGYSTVGDNLDAILLVPLDHAITRSYSIPDRELLYTRSLHYIFNSRVVTKVKWYQQGWFAALVMIVGIVLTVASLGADGGFFANTAAVIAGTMTVAAYVVTLIVMAEFYVYILVASKLFVKVLGEEFAMIVAIITTLYVGYKGMQAGSIKGAPWATELLGLSNGLTTEANASMAKSIKALRNETDVFNAFVKDKTAELESIEDELNKRTLLQPMDIVMGQTPTQFYNMRIHSNNIGIIGIDSIASFVDVALTLPKLNDTLTGDTYV